MTDASPVRRTDSRSAIKRARRWGRYWTARATLGILAKAPRRASHGVLGGVGGALFDLMPKQRRLVLDQIDAVYADRPIPWRRHLARRVFAELGRSAADVGLLARSEARVLRAVTTWESAVTPAALDVGAVVVSAHYGPWELLPASLSLLGYATTVVVRPNREPRLDALLRRLRAVHGVSLVDRGDGAALRRALRAGRLLVLAGDQRPRGRRVAGTFLGRAAWLPAGPATLADLCSRPLVPMIIRRTRRGDNRIVVGRAIESDCVRRVDRVADMTRAASRWLEEEISRDAAQWAWFHERWRDAPSPRVDEPAHRHGRV